MSRAGCKLHAGAQTGAHLDAHQTLHITAGLRVVGGGSLLATLAANCLNPILHPPGGNLKQPIDDASCVIDRKLHAQFAQLQEGQRAAVLPALPAGLPLLQVLEEKQKQPCWHPGVLVSAQQSLLFAAAR